MNWELMTSEEFADAVKKSKGVCLLPLGVIEPFVRGSAGLGLLFAEGAAFDPAATDDFPATAGFLGRVGAGLDIPLGNWFAIGLAADIGIHYFTQEVGTNFSAIRGEGEPLAAEGGKAGAAKPFVHVVEQDVVVDQAQILRHFVDHRALGLTPGRHRLILSYSAACQGMRATTEEEHLLDLTAAPSTKP